MYFRNLWKAWDSAFRAFMKQWRTMRTKQRKAAIPDPFVPF